MLSIFKLTDYELENGLQTIEQLQRVKDDPWSFEDIKGLVALPWNIFRWDCKEYTPIEKLYFTVFWWPVYYIAINFISAFIC